MTDEDAKIRNALRTCADVRLPDDFADRLVKRIRERGTHEERKTSGGTVFTRIVLVAASLTLLLGFVPGVLENPSGKRTGSTVLRDEIRAKDPALPRDSQLNALAFLGFCREVIRRRVRSFLDRGRKREDEE